MLPGVFWVGFLLIGFASGLFGLLPLPVGEPVMNGKWMTRFEKDFDARLWHRPAGIALWGATEFFAFGNGRPGVLIGEGGWLYSDEEFRSTAGAAEQIERKRRVIRAVADHLRQHDVQLVVALLPSKSRIVHEHLGRYRLPAEPAARYAHFREALLADGLRAPDLATPLAAARAKDEVFLRTDTHWTPFGARIVAAELAKGLAFEGRGASTFTDETLPAREHRGDLLAFVPLGPLQAQGPAADRVREVTVRAQSAPSLGLFDDVSIPVALVGTSYSKASEWGFRDALRQQLGAEVLDAAQLGRGPILPMLAYLDNAAFLESPPKVVIWEIPERYLVVPEAEEELKASAPVLQRLGLLEGEG